MITPMVNKDLKPEETFVPDHIDLKNGHLSGAGIWEDRPGYAQKWDTTIKRPIDLLIPGATSFAITDNGRFYKLGNTVSELTGTNLGGSFRPTYANHQGILIVCDGGAPQQINNEVVSALGGSPPNAKFVDTLDTYVLMSGHSGTRFVWSQLANSAIWPAANFNDVLGDGEEIVFMKVFKRDIFFFKTNSIEVWVDVGGTTIFARKLLIEKGCIASYSVVQANDTFYWLGDDGDFYVLNGITPKIISNNYRAEIDKIIDQPEVYGFDFRKEGVIRWFAPTEGKCFVYDYITNTFSEDNEWGNGDWKRLPINSYMEVNNRQYFGDFNMTGLVYEWSKDFKDDNGTPIRRFRKFAVLLSGDGTDSLVNRLRFRVKRGVATASETTPQASVRWRFDQGDFGDTEILDLGAVGDRDPYVDIYNLGMGREVEFEIAESDSVDFFLTHGFLTVEPLRG